MEVSLRRGRTKVRAPQRAPALPARHHQPARLARVSKLASETHEIPCRTPPCALAGSIILSTAGSVLMSVDNRPIRYVGKRAFLDLFPLTIGLAQQVCGRRGAVRNAIHVHDSCESRFATPVKK